MWYPPYQYSMLPPDFYQGKGIDPVKQAKAWKKFLKEENETKKKEMKKDDKKVRTFHTMELFCILLFASPFVGMVTTYLIIHMTKSYIAAMSALLK